MSDASKEDTHHRGIRRIVIHPDGTRRELPRSVSDAAHFDAYGNPDNAASFDDDGNPVVRGPYGEAIPLNITPDPDAEIETDDAPDANGDDGSDDQRDQHPTHESTDAEPADRDTVRGDPDRGHR
ncbi:MAG: hypothetical protein LC748_12955 [Thermomicrobia bacterium]|nr:hypothetical protein [Thermomicrobia bacterium]